MKNSGICPKCSAKKVLRIEGSCLSHGNNVPAGWFSAVPVTRFLCATCGFSEEWIEDPVNLEALQSKYAQFTPA